MQKKYFFEFLLPDNPEFHDNSLSSDPKEMLYLPTLSGFLFFYRLLSSVSLIEFEGICQELFTFCAQMS